MDGKEFIKALKNMAKDLVIDEDYIFASMEQALITAYKKNFHSKSNVKVEINKETGDIKVYTYYVVVDDYIDGPEIVDEEGNITYGEPEIPEDAQMLLEDAKKIDPDAQVGETIKQEVTPKDFGRVAVSTAKQVLTQKIREAERTSIVNEYIGKQDEIMVGMLAMEDNKNYYVDLGRARGILPKSEMIPGETVKMGSSIRVYLTKVEESTKGPLILCSRKNTNFVKRLFEVEIPELADGTLVLYNVAREAGIRSKVAVYSTVNNIDAIGTCIGEKGIRIANILKELNGEKVDLIRYEEDDAAFIANALSPAKDVIVNIIDDKEVMDSVGYECYDIVMANILAPVLIELAPIVVNHMKKGGVFITSGIIEGKEDSVCKAMEAAGLKVVEVTAQGEWRNVTARKD